MGSVLVGEEDVWKDQEDSTFDYLYLLATATLIRGIYNMNIIEQMVLIGNSLILTHLKASKVSTAPPAAGHWCPYYMHIHSDVQELDPCYS